jgi:two-component system LytT family sensor kinase
MNMNVSLRHMIENRAGRHILFWVCWVMGFTFIKSFGKPYEVYFGWFSYYVVTLPIFVAHTYLVAYVLIPHLFSRRLLPVFIALFLGLLYGFSVLELILSNEFIYRWFPTGSRITEDYLSPGNVLRSGLGNLYIVLVFLAARTVRNWSIASKERKELMQVELKEQMEETMTRIQPLMLLYAIDYIDRMVERSDPGVTRAIALTSELLSEVMIYHEEGKRWISREIELVKKLVSLVELFRGNRLDVEFFISGDPGTIELPPMILFSFVDLLFRRFDRHDQIPELNIEASGFSNMITIQVLQEESGGHGENLEECMMAIKQLESIYSGDVDIGYNMHSYGCSVIIRSGGQSGRNAAHTFPGDVHTAKPAGA